MPSEEDDWVECRRRDRDPPVDPAAGDDPVFRFGDFEDRRGGDFGPALPPRRPPLVLRPGGRRGRRTGDLDGLRGEFRRGDLRRNRSARVGLTMVTITS